MARARIEPLPGDPTVAPSHAARWADLRLRILSATVLAPLALGCIWIGGAAFAGLSIHREDGIYVWIPLVAVTAALACYEAGRRSMARPA